MNIEEVQVKPKTTDPESKSSANISKNGTSFSLSKGVKRKSKKILKDTTRELSEGFP